MNAMQKAIIKKDIRSITANKRIFSVLLLVPLVLAVVLPSILLISVYVAPDQSDFQQLLSLVPAGMQIGNIEKMLTELMLNNIMPIFFMMIPIMASSVMAASAFVGEKEKRTLETLLYGPFTIKEVFRAKILASFIMSMMISLLSFVVMVVALEIELVVLSGPVFIPGFTWLLVMLLEAPAISLISITLIVRGSAKAQTMEESQQRSVFLVMPIILLMVGQFSGLLLINSWMLLGAGVVLAVLAVLLVRGAVNKFDYEMLLK